MPSAQTLIQITAPVCKACEMSTFLMRRISWQRVSKWRMGTMQPAGGFLTRVSAYNHTRRMGIVKRIFSVLIVMALILGCRTSVAQSVVMAALATTSSLATTSTLATTSALATTCQIQGIELYNNKNCVIIEKIMAGQLVPFGPDLSARDDIQQLCEKVLVGFMDENRMSNEIRERHFHMADNYSCFKAYNSKGEKQQQGEWVNEARDLGSKKEKPRVLYGTNGTAMGNIRVAVISGRRR